MKVIEVKDLAKTYYSPFGNIEAVKGISFEVEEGEIFGFLGPNGAGKSTTIMMLTTLVKPTKGTAKILGYDVVHQPNEVRRVIGYVSQDLTVDDTLTGWENMYLQGRFYHLPKEVIKQRSEELLKLLRLYERAKDKAETYSGGMRKRLDIAMGLIHRPKILFLDEPTLGLDVQTRQDIWEYVQKIRKENGMTIFLTTHYMEEADSLCDRIAIIDKGEIKALDTPRRLKDSIGGDLISLKISNESLEEISKFLEKVKTLEVVKNITSQDGRYTIVASNAEKLIPVIFSIAYESNINISSITMKKPSLDDVYLAYTGKEFRDEEGSKEDAMRMRRLVRRTR
ncbi:MULTISPECIES: ATP-binding cassette domain-containing protein [Dictyoglomus]|jgi:ABC-2 type transport system ATP-binding protein|uniref:ATP-binding cassette domain-containing protein n=2 Tax=Dictyoglomaceae TaxID=203488 RepID=UPI000CCF6E05|nr:ATP-binding cassette domain-containing protein [Dictyoglomus turgidum]PNV80930.1 MAG: DrrA-related ABC transporter ATP-binding protein [Dictyoglomus turgidum]